MPPKRPKQRAAKNEDHCGFLKQISGRFCACMLAVSCIWAPTSTEAKSTIRLINLDGPGEGLNDPTPVTPVGGNTATTLGAQRLNALRYAADILETILASDVTIEIGVRFDADEKRSTAFAASLAAAGPNTYHYDFQGAVSPGIWHVQALANKLYGADLATADDCVQENSAVSNCYDIGAVFNSSVDDDNVLGNSSWYYGFDGPTAEQTTEGNDFDLITVAVHEWLHGLGFISFVNTNSGGFLFSPEERRDLPDRYSSFIRLQDGNPEAFIDMSDNERIAAIKSTGRLQWMGEHGNRYAEDAQAGVTDGHAQLYAPSEIALGASVSHIDTSYRPRQMMAPFYTNPNHDVGIGAAFLADIGWGNYTDLAVHIAASANPASLTDPTDYKIAVSNHGENDAPDTVVEYTLPADTDFISAEMGTRESVDNMSCTVDAERVLACPIGTVYAHTTQILTVTLQHDAPGVLGHTGNVHANIVEAAPNNNTFSIATQVENGAQTLTAVAGAAQQALPGNLIQLDGTNSFGSSTITNYAFDQLTGATAQVFEQTPGLISVNVPLERNDLLFQLTVSDAQGRASSDFTLVIINTAPSANAGPNQSVLIDTVAALDASASTDTDGRIVAYQWQQISGPSITLNDANTATPTFTTPGRELELGFEVTVTDTKGATDTAQTTVSVITPTRKGGGGRLNWLAVLALALMHVQRTRRPKVPPL